MRKTFNRIDFGQIMVRTNYKIKSTSTYFDIIKNKNETWATMYRIDDYILSSTNGIVMVIYGDRDECIKIRLNELTNLFEDYLNPSLEECTMWYLEYGFEWLIKPRN